MKPVAARVRSTTRSDNHLTLTQCWKVGRREVLGTTGFLPFSDKAALSGPPRNLNRGRSLLSTWMDTKSLRASVSSYVIKE